MASMNRLPPLNSLRVFSVVGRLLSISHAAAALHVTSSAVSHQIKTLEEYLGVTLLLREGNHVVLTQVGKDYLSEITASLENLSRATGEVLKTKYGPMLTVVTTSSIASWWLMPRIDRFLQANPDVVFSLSIFKNRLDIITSGRADVGIVCGPIVGAGLDFDQLVHGRLMPVCNPMLMRDPVHPLRSPADLRYHTLIDNHSDLLLDGDDPGWSGWLSETGMSELVHGTRRVTFSPMGLMLQAVSRGLGVGLSQTLLVADAIARGQLVCPFGPVIPVDSTYYLVCRQAAANNDVVGAFRAWLMEEVRLSMSDLTMTDTRVTSGSDQCQRAALCASRPHLS